MRVVISHCVVQVAFHIVIRLVLRIGVVDIHFITITIFSLSITSPSIGSINVIDVSLFQIFAASTAFTPYTAALPAHVGKARPMSVKVTGIAARPKKMLNPLDSGSENLI